MDRKENRARRFHEIEKGATAAPFFDGRGQLTASCRPSSSRPWLSSPLSFIPPFIWVCLRERSDVVLWLPPGTLTRFIVARRVEAPSGPAPLRPGYERVMFRLSSSLGMA